MKSFTTHITNVSLITAFSFCLISFGLIEQGVAAGKSTEIYKWVDQEGRIHYAARPGDDSAEKMHLGSKIFHKRDNDRLTEKAQQKNQERKKLCQDSKDTLKKYKSAPFLYRNDETTGQKIRLTESESQETFLQAEKDISYWCTPPKDTTDTN